MAWKLEIAGFMSPREEGETGQDAAACNLRTGRFAVADGVSEALQSGRWARRLVWDFVRRPPGELSPRALAAWLAPRQEKHDNWMGNWVETRERRNLRRYYMLRNKAHLGSQSTFLCVRLEQPEETSSAVRWRAVTVGDCCLFLWHGQRSPTTWPWNNEEQFDLHPDVVGTHWPLEPETIHVLDGIWKEGDVLGLATDAVAAWILRNPGAIDPWEWLSWPQKRFEAWVDEHRRLDPEHPLKLRTDDNTLLLVTWKKLEENLRRPARDSSPLLFLPRQPPGVISKQELTLTTESEGTIAAESLPETQPAGSSESPLPSDECVKKVPTETESTTVPASFDEERQEPEPSWWRSFPERLFRREKL